MFGKCKKDDNLLVDIKMLGDQYLDKRLSNSKFICIEVLWPSQPSGVMLSMVNLPNHTFSGQA